MQGLTLHPRQVSLLYQEPGPGDNKSYGEGPAPPAPSSLPFKQAGVSPTLSPNPSAAPAHTNMVSSDPKILSPSLPPGLSTLASMTAFSLGYHRPLDCCIQSDPASSMRGCRHAPLPEGLPHPSGPSGLLLRPLGQHTLPSVRLDFLPLPTPLSLGDRLLP